MPNWNSRGNGDARRQPDGQVLHDGEPRPRLQDAHAGAARRRPSSPNRRRARRRARSPSAVVVEEVHDVAGLVARVARTPAVADARVRPAARRRRSRLRRRAGSGVSESTKAANRSPQRRRSRARRAGVRSGARIGRHAPRARTATRIAVGAVTGCRRRPRPGSTARRRVARQHAHEEADRRRCAAQSPSQGATAMPHSRISAASPAVQPMPAPGRRAARPAPPAPRRSARTTATSDTAQKHRSTSLMLATHMARAAAAARVGGVTNPPSRRHRPAAARGVRSGRRSGALGLLARRHARWRRATFRATVLGAPPPHAGLRRRAVPAGDAWRWWPGGAVAPLRPRRAARAPPRARPIWSRSTTGPISRCSWPRGCRDAGHAVPEQRPAGHAPRPQPGRARPAAGRPRRRGRLVGVPAPAGCCEGVAHRRRAPRCCRTAIDLARTAAARAAREPSDPVRRPRRHRQGGGRLRRRLRPRAAARCPAGGPR